MFPTLHQKVTQEDTPRISSRFELSYKVDGSRVETNILINTTANDQGIWITLFYTCRYTENWCSSRVIRIGYKLTMVPTMSIYIEVFSFSSILFSDQPRNERWRTELLPPFFQQLQNLDFIDFLFFLINLPFLSGAGNEGGGNSLVRVESIYLPSMYAPLYFYLSWDGRSRSCSSWEHSQK